MDAIAGTATPELRPMPSATAATRCHAAGAKARARAGMTRPLRSAAAVTITNALSARYPATTAPTAAATSARASSTSHSAGQFSHCHSATFASA